MTKLDHFKAWVSALLMWVTFRLFYSTYRIDYAAGEEHLQALVDEDKPAILNFWHEGMFVVYSHVHAVLVRRGHATCVMVSQSKDGEMAAKLARMLGVHAVRGSSSRGGTKVLRDMYRKVIRDKCSPIISPDGPRGPAYKVKPGSIALAQTSKTPILPIGFKSERYWKLRSWDRLVIPKPFSRCTLIVGEPVIISNDISPGVIETECERLEGILNDLKTRVESAAGPGQ